METEGERGRLSGMHFTSAWVEIARRDEKGHCSRVAGEESAWLVQRSAVAQEPIRVQCNVGEAASVVRLCQHAQPQRSLALVRSGAHHPYARPSLCALDPEI